MTWRAEGTSRITWEIEPIGDSCRLTVTHDQLREGANDRDLRRLADDPLRPQDLVGDRKAPDHTGIAPIHVSLAATAALRSRDGHLRHPHQ